jgi:hypothetical protein
MLRRNLLGPFEPAKFGPTLSYPTHPFRHLSADRKVLITPPGFIVVATTQWSFRLSSHDRMSHPLS